MAYLDHNATTPLDERVLEAMRPYLGEGFGNPSSLHRRGRLAADALSRAREQVAALVGAQPDRVIFTSGGTEANNLALKGVGGSGRILVSAVEHASVMAPVGSLARHGRPVGTIPVDGEGRVEMAAFQGLLSDAGLVSVMAANNETGVVQEVAELAGMAREAGALFHTDAVQAAGKLPLRTGNGIGLMTLSAHKFAGPQGVGALVADRSIELEPLLHGGGQERGVRCGTQNVAGIVGFGCAAELAAAELDERSGRSCRLRDRFEAELRARFPDAVIFAGTAPRLPNTSFFALPGIEGTTLVLGLDRRGLAVSSGAACGSGHDEPSHVLAAMGVPAETARGAVRVSFGPGNDEADVDALLTGLSEQSTSLRRMAAAAW